MGRMKRRSFLTAAGLAPWAWARPRIEGGRRALREETPPAESYGSYDPWIEVDLAAIAFNIRQIERKTARRPILAVLKCNAYGHGLVETAKYLEKLPVRGIAVGKLNEAVTLRQAGLRGMILNLGPFGPDDTALIVRQDISQSAYTDAVLTLDQTAKALNKRAKVHVKIDTGLGRVGVHHEAALAFLRRVARLPHIVVEGVFHSFSEDPEFDLVQHRRFLAVTDAARREGLSLGLRHAAASTAIFRYGEEFFLDMVRPGISIYGHYPTEEEHRLKRLELRPALSLKTRASLVKDIVPGESLSYFRKFVAEKPERILTAALGYADGIPLELAQGAQGLVRGRCFPFIGEVTASHSYIRVTGRPDIRTGDEIVLIGRQDGAEIALWGLAQAVKKSDYKILIGLSPALRRIYRA